MASGKGLLRRKLTDAARWQLVEAFSPLPGQETRELTVDLRDLASSRLPPLPAGDSYDSLVVEITRDESAGEWVVTIEPCLGLSPSAFSVAGSIGPQGDLKEVTFFHESASGDPSTEEIGGRGTMFAASMITDDSSGSFSPEALEVAAAFRQFDALLALLPIGQGHQSSSDRPT